MIHSGNIRHTNSETSKQKVLHHLKKIKLPLQFSTPECEQIQLDVICHKEVFKKINQVSFNNATI